MKKRCFILVFILVARNALAQYGCGGFDRIGVILGVNQFKLTTAYFQTTVDIFCSAGLSVRGNFYDNSDLMYALQCCEPILEWPPIDVMFKM
jgi:hypothetical protein